VCQLRVLDSHWLLSGCSLDALLFVVQTRMAANLHLLSPTLLTEQTPRWWLYMCVRQGKCTARCFAHWNVVCSSLPRHHRCPSPQLLRCLSAYACTCVWHGSKLWGCKGELYDMVNSLGSQRLLDWSYAGYMAGEMPIPRLALVGSVMDFGAVGDGVADDTQVRVPSAGFGRHTELPGYHAN